MCDSFPETDMHCIEYDNRDVGLLHAKRESDIEHAHVHIAIIKGSYQSFYQIISRPGERSISHCSMLPSTSAQATRTQTIESLPVSSTRTSSCMLYTRSTETITESEDSKEAGLVTTSKPKIIINKNKKKRKMCVHVCIHAYTYKM